MWKDDTAYTYLFFLDNVEDSMCERDKDGSNIIGEFIDKMSIYENIKVLVTYRN